MKIRLQKILTVLIPALLMLGLSGCLKTASTYTDFAKTTDFVILANAGTANFKAANVQVNTTLPDTVKLSVTANLASNNNNNGPVTVTIALDPNKIAAYNSANGTAYQPFPAGSYKPT